MKITETEFQGVYIIENFYQFDIRGNSVKLYNQDAFREMGLDIELREIYYSTSQKDII